MSYQFTGIPEDICRAFRNGRLDANGQKPQETVSDGGGNPCRCCLDEVPRGMGMLVFGHRPFEIVNPYAEVGPIFLCENCSPYSDHANMPPVLSNRPRHLLKGYSADDRIVYGTGQIVETSEIPAYLTKTFADPEISYVHVRSATNNCFTLRVGRSNPN